MTTLFALIRAIHFASLMTLFGSSALLLHAHGVTDAPLRRLFRICGAAALASGALWPLIAPGSFGPVFAARAVLLLILVLLGLRDGAHAAKAIVAGLALALMGLTSHAAAAGAPRYADLRAAVDAVHLLAAGFWVGGLVVLLPQVLPRPRDTARLVALLRLFSRRGVLWVAVLIATGTINGIAILGVPGVWSGTYVTLLAVKIVLAGLMVALALTNRFGVLPALAQGETEAKETIPLTVSAELGAALLILLIVGFLGLTAPMQM